VEPAEDSMYEMIPHKVCMRGSPLGIRKIRINNTFPRILMTGRQMSISRGLSSSIFHRQFLDSNLSSFTAIIAHG